MALETLSKKGIQFNPTKKFLKKGDNLRGYYKKFEEKLIKSKLAKVHTYLTEEGLVEVIGQADILYFYEDNDIKPNGIYVDITFTGEMRLNKKSGNETKVYQVKVDRDNIDTSSMEEPLADDEDDGSYEPAPVTRTAARAPVSAESQARIQALVGKRK